MVRVAEHPLQRQIADALRLEIAPPGKVSGHGVVWWSVDHAAYAGTAPAARVGRGIVAGICSKRLLMAAITLRYVHPASRHRHVACLDAWGIPRARRLA